MAVTFNADEIFEMAEEIERNAAKFYREASRKAKAANVKKMLLDLSAMEDGHLKTFQEMREKLSSDEKESNVFDPEDQAILYLQTMADGHGTEGLKAPGMKLTGKETIAEMLLIAIEAEKNSVVFYSGLKAMVPVRSGRVKVEEIIDEELGHLAMLKQQLATMET